MIYLIIFLSFFTTLKSELRDNYFIIDSLSKSQSIKISNLLKENNLNKFELFITTPYNPIIFKANLNQTFDEQKLLNLQGSDSLEIELIKYGVEYAIHNSDSLIRTTSIKSLVLNKVFEEINQTYISREDISKIENSPYSELKGVVPEKELSLWDKVVEPFVIIGSVLITVLLLFTVRS